LNNLKTFFTRSESVLVAYSGGVDSSFLLKVGTDAIGREKCVGVTVKSEFFTKNEVNAAKKLAEEHNFNHYILDVSCLANKDLAKNPPNRCYVCKKMVFSQLKKFAIENGFNVVADGSNFDDNSDYRPGRKALSELNIKSPLKEYGFAKSDIREFAKTLSLTNWDSPSASCLATRIPYGTEITLENLEMIHEPKDHTKKFRGKKV